MMATRWLSAAPLFIALLSVIRLPEALGQTHQITQSQTITLGIVSETNRSIVAEHFTDFIRYVAANFTSVPKVEGKVLVAPTTFELAKLFDEKKVDFYMDSPYPTYVLNEVYDVARLLLRRWKGGVAEYRSLIFTRTMGGIRSLQELRGKIIMFEYPESTSGYFLPRAFLTQKGFFLADRTRYDPYASPSDVGYRFAYSQRKLLDAVLTGQAAAGAFSDADYSSLDPKKKAELTILAETESLPRHLVSVRKYFPPNLQNQLKKILLSMHENEQGRKVLKNTDDTTKFDLLPGGEVEIHRRMAEIFHPGPRK
jgi:phosphonate transport system substrate-binding protein